MKRLTRESVLAGTSERAWVDVGEGGGLKIRPLTDGELSSVELAGMEGLPTALVDQLPKIRANQSRVKMLRKIAAMPGENKDGARKAQAEIDEIEADKIQGLDMNDLAALKECESRCNAKAAAFALSCDGEEWTPDDAERLPRGLPEKVAVAAMALSGASEEGAGKARGFRLDESGAGSSGA